MLKNSLRMSMSIDDNDCCDGLVHVHILPLLLSSCPAVCSIPSLASVSLPFALGFFATGGGTLTPFFPASLSTPVFSVTGLVSITTLLLLLEKMKLAVLDGDLWTSLGDVGECRLRRDGGFSFDLAAVLRRIASCRFMEGDEVMAGGDFLVGDRAVEEEVVGITRDWVFGRVGCEADAAGGEVDVGEVGVIIIRDLLMGF